MEPLEHWQDVLENRRSRYSTSKNERGLQAAPVPRPQSFHKPLAPSKEEFRILHLLPSADLDATIQGVMEHVSFNHHPPYEAVSYTWGDPRNTSTITIDGLEFSVTSNLVVLLRHLRKPNVSRALWVDALCIDQQNSHERSLQVRLMRRIYSSCLVDLVWLGEAESAKVRAFEIAATLERADLEAMRGRVRAMPWQERDRLGLYSDATDAYTVLTRDDWNELRSVFSQPTVWGRVWIMQEIACAPRVILMSGHNTLDWDVIAKFLDSGNYPDAYHAPFHHNNYEAHINEIFANAQIIEHQRAIVRNMDTGYVSRLLDVLARFRFTEATNPRDKIYGLLGLASDAMGIIPDYSKSVGEVYTGFFQAYVNTTQDLDLLCQSPWHFGSMMAPKKGMPSWCPDFANPRLPGPGVLFAQRSIFSSGSEKCRTSCRILDEIYLQVEGVCLDQLAGICGEPERDPDAPYSYLSPLDFIEGSIPKQLRKKDADERPVMYAWTGEPAFQAYWRTILTDCKRYPTCRLDPATLHACSELLESWREGDKPFEYYDGEGGSVRAELYGLGVSVMSELNFATTESGIYCMVPRSAIVGDEVAIFSGGKVPMVIRRQKPGTGANERRCHGVVGPAYAHGFMDGQGAALVHNGDLAEASIFLS
ncbi:Uu.00g064710.m01.CDS01 [Anthostomella pinea]|uniref:Uu.00g064710.m01.CDS01 n=1 Tax=Anthostomella pinea TaxID=933095 RepID=A0AAI8VTL4_9PEZI|nr:Uu.00g064710.m01.CDS01 [Anthostomella pinea]